MLPPERSANGGLSTFYPKNLHDAVMVCRLYGMMLYFIQNNLDKNDLNKNNLNEMETYNVYWTRERTVIIK